MSIKIMISQPTPSSREADIDRQMEDLIGKMLSGKANKTDVIKYNELAAERGHMLRPKFPSFRRTQYVVAQKRA
jgi:hypothetical protein